MARRTAKQRAATRRLVSFNKRRKRSSTRRAPRRSMPRRRRSTRRRSVSGGFRRARSGIGGVLKSGIIRKAILGVGAATIATVVLNRVAPQFAPIGGTAAAFLSGGLVGGAINLFLSGGLNQLGGLFGGQSANGAGVDAV